MYKRGMSICVKCRMCNLIVICHWLMLGQDNVPGSWVRAWNHQERPPGAKSSKVTPRPPSTHRPASQDRHTSSM